MRRIISTAALLCGSTLIALSSPAAAQEETELDLITVTINKVRQALSDAVGGVSVADRAEVEQQADQSVRDVLAPMPGVSTQQTADDPATAINVRGLQDFGRVAVTIDGARQNFQRTGHNANGTFYFDPEMMQQVTVIRGPIANVYGSGAIGGVVAFETIDALSFLREDENWAGQQRVRYDTNAEGLMSSTIGAVRLGEYGGVLGNLIYRDSEDYTDGGGNVVPNSSRDLIAGLVKGTLTPADGHRLDVSYILNSDSFATQVVGGSTVYDNEVDAETLAAKYRWDGSGNPLIDLTVGAYWTATEQNQERLNDFTIPGRPGSPPTFVSPPAGSSQNFRIDTYGTDFFNTSRFETGTLTHVLTIGGDIFQDEVETDDPEGAGEVYTPSGSRTVGGAFIQDQIGVTPWLDVIAAGRFDAYRLEGDGVNSEGSHFSPKATVVLKPFLGQALSGLHFYGTVAQGYRAPAITETLLAGTHPFPAFNFLPNPDLQPETATSYEAGVTGNFDDVLRPGDSLSMRAGIFRNDVEDYIGGEYIDVLGNNVIPNRLLGCTRPGALACLADDTFQYVNISEARLWGVEGEITYDQGRFFAGVAGSAIRGDDLTSDEPLLTVPADKLVTTLGFRFLDEKAVLGARWFAVAAQDRVPEGATPSEPYNLVNLFSSFDFNEDLSVGLNVDNLFDEEYEVYLDTANSPGRSILFTFTGRLGG
jgi:hemoglobin/transferrin/lactoferrin receptor protein